MLQFDLEQVQEINDSQRESRCRTIEVFDEKRERTLPLALFPADRQLPNFAAGIPPGCCSFNLTMRLYTSESNMLSAVEPASIYHSPSASDHHDSVKERL